VDFFARQEAARRTTQVLRVIFPICVLVVTAAITCLTYVVCGGANPHTSDVAAVPATLAALITLTIVFGASLYKTLELRAGLGHGAELGELYREPPGSVIGEISFFDGRPRTATVWAVDTVTTGTTPFSPCGV